MTTQPTRRGVCLVLASAPGVGKTSVSRALLEMEPDLSLSISATTRARRPGEQEGVHYFFKAEAEFDAMAGRGELLEKLPGDVVGICLLPPSMAELERRLRGRAQESEAEIARRLVAARDEIAHWSDFDHVVVNRDFDRTVAEVRAILHAARSTRVRQPWLPDFVAELLKS